MHDAREMWSRRIPTYTQDILARELPQWPTFAEAPQVLRSLKASGYRLAILSNVDRDLIQPSLQQLSVSMDLVITAEDVRSYKPAPAHWEALLRQAGVVPAEILHVAAGLHYDIPTAQDLGLGTCWINRRGENSWTIRPETRLSNLTGLVTLLAATAD
jgi:2-haloacid dehalogenase